MWLYVIYLNNLSSSPGIVNKISSKLDSFNLSGKPIDGVFFLNDIENDIPSNLKRKYIFFVKTNDDFYKTLNDFLNKNKLYKTIILRYPIASYQLYQFLKKNPGKIIFEHNSKEIEELSFELKSFSFKDWLYLIRNLHFYKPITNFLYEFFLGKKILQLALAGIAVTPEIAEYEKKRSGYRYNIIPISNGVDTNTIMPIKNPKWDGKTLNLIVICSSSNANKWQGIDRIIKSILSYRGEISIRLNLIGSYNEKIHSMTNPSSSIQFKFWGHLSRNEISKIISESHLGIGSLALHRIPLKQGAVLKVREYMSMGLPFIIGYDDVDIPNDYPYCLKCSPDELPIEMDKIISFTSNLYSRGFSSEKMRNASVSLINSRIKIAQYIQFIEGL